MLAVSFRSLSTNEQLNSSHLPSLWRLNLHPTNRDTIPRVLKWLDLRRRQQRLYSCGKKRKKRKKDEKHFFFETTNRCDELFPLYQISRQLEMELFKRTPVWIRCSLVCVKAGCDYHVAHLLYLRYIRGHNRLTLELISNDMSRLFINKFNAMCISKCTTCTHCVPGLSLLCYSGNIGDGEWYNNYWFKLLYNHAYFPLSVYSRQFDLSGRYYIWKVKFKLYYKFLCFNTLCSKPSYWSIRVNEFRNTYSNIFLFDLLEKI